MEKEQEDKEMLRILRDPVLWAKHHLNANPRWYQEEILRHPHHRKVLRCGRRIGKCIEETQRIVNPRTGEYRTVKEWFEMQDHEMLHLLSLDDRYKLTEAQPMSIEDNGKKPTYRVKTKHGAEVILTGNHPVLTVNGWVEVDDLDIGDFIATPKQLPVFGHKVLSYQEAYWLGSVFAGGTLRDGRLTFRYKDDAVGDAFKGISEMMGLRVRKSQKHQGIYYVELSDAWLEGGLASFFEGMEKKTLQFAMQFEKETLKMFLAGLYDSNGWNFGGRIAEIGYGSRSKDLLIELKHLLLRIGVQSNLLHKQAGKETYWQLMIYYRNQIITFHEQIVEHAYKDYSKTIKRAREMEPTSPILPKEIWTHIEVERHNKKMTKTAVTGSKTERFRMNHGLGIDKAARYADNLQSEFLWDMAHADILWEEVIDIESLGMRQTYDVMVPEHHNLVVEDIFVHNTWTMAIHMLWVAFTCNGGRETEYGSTCVVATPYDSQAALIFNELKKFIEKNPLLAESIESMTKNPYYIKFKNGSEIKLFTAGTRSGAEGGSLRGQKASWLYMDKHFVPHVSDRMLQIG